MSFLLGKLEQQVMDVMWSSDTSLKVAEVQERMDGEYAYTTIMTVLKRLCKKGILDRELNGNVYFYCALKCKKDFASKKLGNLFDKLVGSYGELAISKFIDSVSKSPEDIKLLKDYLKDKDE